MSTAAEYHRDQTVKLLACCLADLPGYDQVAHDYAERIVDGIVAASVETFKALVAAEQKLEGAKTTTR